jgi:hypothetical protein
MDRRAIWKELTQLGPFRWNNVAPLRAARVALGVDTVDDIVRKHLVSALPADQQPDTAEALNRSLRESPAPPRLRPDSRAAKRLHAGKSSRSRASPAAL